VAIVNEALARRAWPGQNPIGRQVEHQAQGGPVMLTVVGVTTNARLVSLNAEAAPFIYVPVAQQDVTRLNLVVRTRDGRSAIPDVRQLIRTMNPNLPVTEAMALTQITALGTIPQRIAAAVAGSLGIVGLLLAGIGIYGVTAYAVSRRTREIGIRMALGADSAKVLRLVLRQTLAVSGIGIIAGIGLAAAGSQLLESLLLGVRGLDPFTFGGACGLFALMTLAASYVPARRAIRVNPVDALRAE
jgi:ABC-type antimicrobial peptide transport system permease subunit